MRITNIQNNNTPTSKGFRVTPEGAVKLANDFVKNPDLENRFIEHIVKPLKNTNTDVVFDGYSTYYKNLDGKYSSIVQAYKNSKDVIVRETCGPRKWIRDIFRPKNNTTLEPVKEFNEYPYNEIEAAKNIAQNISIDTGNNIKLSEKMQNTFFPSNHPLAKKIQEIIEYLS